MPGFGSIKGSIKISSSAWLRPVINTFGSAMLPLDGFLPLRCLLRFFDNIAMGASIESCGIYHMIYIEIVKMNRGEASWAKMDREGGPSRSKRTWNSRFPKPKASVV